MTDRKSGQITRRLATLLEQDDVAGFAALLDTDVSLRQFENIRTQKLLVRGKSGTRLAAVEVCLSRIPTVLGSEAAQEYERYAQLCIEIASVRERLGRQIEQEKEKFPRLSLRQLLQVAERCLDKTYDLVIRGLPDEGPNLDAGENARRLHERSGRANDLLFGIARAVNVLSDRIGKRDLLRTDALSAARARFNRLATIASRLNGVEYVLDSASFGDFAVTEMELDKRRFKLDFADFRLVLLRQLHIRRSLVLIKYGRRNERFVRKELNTLADLVITNAFDAYDDESLIKNDVQQKLREYAKALLWVIEAEDDLAFLAAGSSVDSRVHYTIALAMRLFAEAAKLVRSELPGKARRAFDDSIDINELVAALEPGEAREVAESTWNDLVTELPARSHFDILRRPFLQISHGKALPFRPAAFGGWTTSIRELLIKGGESGRRYGAIWEEFFSSTFADTGWTIVGRNIKLSEDGCPITEVDLLLLRADLLLVVEVKALIGSGLSPYDHWKNRIVIEKGCRQARLASEHLRQKPSALASIINSRTAERIKHIQPVVLTNESMFDGWEHDGVPVIGETIRQAITNGSSVEYFNGATLEVLGVDHHLKVEDLSTETILAALRAPIELAIAPEQGAVEHIWEGAGGLMLGIPVPAVGSG